MAFDLDPSYKQVPERIADFKEKHPEGRLRPVDPARPYWIETIGDKTFLVYAAAAYLSADDPLPGIGLAWEPFPGRTPYTRDSELQNAETSAWGRAIVAALASESKAIASAEDIRNRVEEQAPAAEQRVPPFVADGLTTRINALSDELRGACKTEFASEFGKPAELKRGQHEAAEALVARYEAAATPLDERKPDADTEAPSSKEADVPPPADPPPPRMISQKKSQQLHIVAGDAAKAQGHLNSAGNGDGKWAEPVLDACVYAVTNHRTTSAAQLTEKEGQQVRVYLDALVDGQGRAEVTDASILLDVGFGTHRFRRGEDGTLALLQGVASA